MSLASALRAKMDSATAWIAYYSHSHQGSTCMHNLATKENAFTSASTQSDSSYDALSPWFEIRSVAMAGFDYVFAPMAMCNQINELISLQEFLINAQAMLGSEPQRTILVGFEYDAQDNLLLDRYDVEWLNDMIVDCRRTTVNGCSQFEFMETLFEHSENLVVI